MDHSSSSSLNSSATNALSLTWAFGFNKDIIDGVHSLHTNDNNALFYVAAHTGVIYDYASRTQQLLQGHCNPITAVAVSQDKKWIVTADAGSDSMMVVWDALSGTPIQNMFNPHPNGITSVDISPDALFLVTLGSPGVSGEEERGPGQGEPQTISLWEWTQPNREHALYTSVIEDSDTQKVVRFNPADIRQIMTIGDHKTMFWGWEDGGLKGYVPSVSRHDFKQSKGINTCCCFLPGTSQAITATSKGEVRL
ncbi:unnamed protein product, partial [Choristocarpus tenellus]